MMKYDVSMVALTKGSKEFIWMGSDLQHVYIRHIQSHI